MSVDLEVSVYTQNSRLSTLSQDTLTLFSQSNTSPNTLSPQPFPLNQFLLPKVILLPHASSPLQRHLSPYQQCMKFPSFSARSAPGEVSTPLLTSPTFGGFMSKIRQRLEEKRKLLNSGLNQEKDGRVLDEDHEEPRWRSVTIKKHQHHRSKKQDRRR